MLLPCIMAGFHFAFLHSVLVEQLFLLNTLYLILKVGYFLFDTIKWEILKLHYWVKCGLKWPLNLSYSQFSTINFLSTANLQDGATLDIDINWFCKEGNSIHLLIFSFNLSPSSNVASCLSASYKNHENTKKRAHGQRIWEIKRALFTPVLMWVKSGLAYETKYFYKQLAS